MADNTVLPVGTGGDTIGSDDIGGVKFQRVKLIHGADGVNAGDVSSANPFPISISQNTGGTTNGVQITALTYPQSTGNNSVVQLAAGATFTGTIETVLSLQAAQIEVVCDQPYTVRIDQFIDAAGTKLSSTYTFTRLAGVPTNEGSNPLPLPLPPGERGQSRSQRCFAKTPFDPRANILLRANGLN